jgi:hypothetical protein
VTQLATRKGALDFQERIEVPFGVHAPQRRIRCQFKVIAKRDARHRRQALTDGDEPLRSLLMLLPA